MHTLAFVNQKGGCGKTTAAVNLAGALAGSAARVLLVDLDPQAHATLALGCAIEDEPTVTDVLAGDRPIDEVVQRVAGEITLLPATERLAEFEETSARMIGPERRLRAALERVAPSYDFAILDCSPRADGVLAANALRAADTALLIVECGTFALQGALKAVGILAEVAEHDAHSFETRVLATLMDRRTRFARELLIAIQARFGEQMFDTAIQTSVRLREAAAAGVPVQVLDPECRSAQEFACLADEVRELAVQSQRSRAHSITGQFSPAEHPSPSRTFEPVQPTR